MAAMHVAHATNPSVMADVTGEITSMAEMAWLPAETIEGLVTGRLDEIAIARFTRVLALVEPAPEPLAPRPASSPPAPAWRLLVPLFQGHVPAATSREPLLADRAWPAMLRRGAVEPVLQAAIGRLRSRVGHVRVAASELARTADGERLAAALFLRPPPAVMTRFLASYIDQPHEQEETP